MGVSLGSGLSSLVCTTYVTQEAEYCDAKGDKSASSFSWNAQGQRRYQKDSSRIYEYTRGITGNKEVYRNEADDKKCHQP